jgi:hypothetical protein
MPLNFESTHVIRVNWEDHGITTQELRIRAVKRDDGVVLGITRNEWFKMLPPLLVRNPNGDWFLGNNLVKVTFTKDSPSKTI